MQLVGAPRVGQEAGGRFPQALRLRGTSKKYEVSYNYGVDAFILIMVISSKPNSPLKPKN